MSSKLYEEAKKREDALANFLKDIVSIPSLSSQEGDVVKFMAEAMKKLGYDEVVIDGMGNLLGRIGDGPRVIAFDGHCDTVDIGDISLWDKVKPYPAVIQDGKVFGRGTADQKGGVAKTTTVASVGAALTGMDLSVLVVDLDPQGSAGWAMGVEADDDHLAVGDVLRSGNPKVASGTRCVRPKGGPEGGGVPPPPPPPQARSRTGSASRANTTSGRRRRTRWGKRVSGPPPGARRA